MESLIVAVGERRSNVAEIFRAGDQPLTFGRGLRNSVVLTDPYVGERQLEFFRRDGHWCVRVVGGVNPVLLNDSPLTGTETRLREGDRLTVGRTNLDIYSEDYQVEPARKLLLSGWLYRGRLALLAGLLATVAVAGMDSLLTHFQYTPQGSREDPLMTGLSAAATIFVWAGMWALVGRLTRHQSHFAIQLLVTALFSGLVTLALPLPSYIDFWFSSPRAGEVSGYLLSVVLLAVLLRWNIYYATHPARPWLGACVMSFLCVGTYLVVDKLQQPEYNPAPQYSATLKPPFLQWRQGREVAAYLAASEAAAKRAAASAARSEPAAARPLNGDGRDQPGSADAVEPAT